MPASVKTVRCSAGRQKHSACRLLCRETGGPFKVPRVSESPLLRVILSMPFEGMDSVRAKYARFATSGRVADKSKRERERETRPPSPALCFLYLQREKQGRGNSATIPYPAGSRLRSSKAEAPCRDEGRALCSMRRPVYPKNILHIFLKNSWRAAISTGHSS